MYLTGKRTAFEQYEAQLYEELQNIIGETGVLHNALDRTLRLEIDAYQKALDPITSTTQRLENLSNVSTSPHSTPGTSAAGFGAQSGLPLPHGGQGLQHGGLSHQGTTGGYTQQGVGMQQGGVGMQQGGVGTQQGGYSQQGGGYAPPQGAPGAILSPETSSFTPTPKILYCLWAHLPAS